MTRQQAAHRRINTKKTQYKRRQNTTTTTTTIIIIIIIIWWWCWCCCCCCCWWWWWIVKRNRRSIQKASKHLGLIKCKPFSFRCFKARLWKGRALNYSICQLALSANSILIVSLITATLLSHGQEVTAYTGANITLVVRNVTHILDRSSTRGTSNARICFHSDPRFYAECRQESKVKTLCLCGANNT